MISEELVRHNSMHPDAHPGSSLQQASSLLLEPILKSTHCVPRRLQGLRAGLGGRRPEEQTDISIPDRSFH